MLTFSVLLFLNSLNISKETSTIFKYNGDAKNQIIQETGWVSTIFAYILTKISNMYHSLSENYFALLVFYRNLTLKKKQKILIYL